MEPVEPLLVDGDTLVVSLIGAISIMAGGFALLGRVALRLFLGKDLDGRGGAWGSLTDAVASIGARVDRMSEQQDESIRLLRKLAPPETDPER